MRAHNWSQNSGCQSCDSSRHVEALALVISSILPICAKRSTRAGACRSSRRFGVTTLGAPRKFLLSAGPNVRLHRLSLSVRWHERCDTPRHACRPVALASRAWPGRVTNHERGRWGPDRTDRINQKTRCRDSRHMACAAGGKWKSGEKFPLFARFQAAENR